MKNVIKVTLMLVATLFSVNSTNFINKSFAEHSKLNKSSIKNKFIFYENEKLNKSMTEIIPLKEKIKLIETVLLTKTSKDTVKYLLAVIRCETGNFKSNVFRKNKNLCGMRYPTPKDKRIRDKNKYVVYQNITESVNDLLRHVRYYKHRSWYHSKRYKEKLNH